MEMRPAGLVLISPQNLVIVARDGQIKQQVYYPAPQLPGLLRALYALNAVRAGLYGAAASAYGDAFAQASQQANDPGTQRAASQIAAEYTKGGKQIEGYSKQSAAMAKKSIKTYLDISEIIF